jgi:hypothetical protein
MAALAELMSSYSVGQADGATHRGAALSASSRVIDTGGNGARQTRDNDCAVIVTE